MKKLLIAAMSLAFAAEAVAETGPKWVQVAQPEPGHVTFTFDDATKSQFSAAFPILVREGIPATLYVTTGPLDRKDTFFMTWDDVRLVHAAGWEIGAHTVTHTALPTLDDITVIGELSLSRERITEEIGERPRSFASPFGEYDERTLAHIARYYVNHVGAWGDNDGRNPPSVDSCRIERVNIDGGLTAEEVCSKVRAVGEGEWLVLMFHQVAEPDGPYISSPQQLKDIARCVADAVSQGAIIADTVSAVHDRLKPKE